MTRANVFRHFYSPFPSPIITPQMLMDYTRAHLVALVTAIPSPDFAARVATTTAAANAFNAGLAEIGSKLATQKMQTEIKKAFRASLPDEILVVYSGLVAAVGPTSPILTECFPKGRTVFMRCQEGAVDDELQVLLTGLGKHTAVVPPAVVTKATSLLTTWNGIYEAAGTAKGTKKTTALSLQELRAALEAELFTNLLMLAILFPDDEVKAAQYCPKHLLEPRGSSLTPGTTTLTLVEHNAQARTAKFSMAADHAEAFHLLRRKVGTADFVQVGDDIEATDEEATFSIYLEDAATYEFAAEAIRGSRTGERSAIVSVTQG